MAFIAEVLSQGTSTYYLKEVAVMVGGYIIKGKERIDINFPYNDSEIFMDVSGAVTRLRHSGSEYCELTIALSQTSGSNLTLQNLYDTALSMPVAIVDGNGYSQFVIPEAVFKKRPNPSFGKEDLSDREWIICGTAAVAIEGGSKN